MLHDLLESAIVRTDVNGAIMRFDVQFNVLTCKYTARATYANGKVIDYKTGYEPIVEVVKK